MAVQRRYKRVAGICRRVRGCMGVERRYKGVESICRRVRGCMGVQRRYKGVEGRLTFFIIHSKCFSVSDWLKAHA